MKNKSFFASCAIFGTIIMATTLLFSSKGNLFSGSVRADSCPHSNVEYHKAIEPSLIRHGHREYWCCCACHKSFSDPDLTKVIENTIGNPLDIGDGRQLPTLGESYGENPTKSGYHVILTREGENM